MWPRVHVEYKVNIYSGKGFKEVLFTSEPFPELYDAKQFIYWLSCQISTPIPYNISMYARVDGVCFQKHFPCNMHPATTCKHYPSKPLTRMIQRQRSEFRERNGLYYEY